MTVKPKAPKAKRPFVVVNMAMTVDGKIATANHTVSSFGSTRDHEHLLELRATADAVMAGARTVDLNAINMGPGGAKFRKLRLPLGLGGGDLLRARAGYQFGEQGVDLLAASAKFRGIELDDDLSVGQRFAFLREDALHPSAVARGQVGFVGFDRAGDRRRSGDGFAGERCRRESEGERQTEEVLVHAGRAYHPEAGAQVRVNRHERMCWARIRSGACVDASASWTAAALCRSSDA